MSQENFDHPAADEVEVSLFGPGVGESIVVHLGNREWVVIDSCNDTETTPSRAVALTYFERIGVNAAKEVRAILCTHWDIDHIRGLGQVVEECEGAEFWCTAAIDNEEFRVLRLLSRKKRTRAKPAQVGHRLRELDRILTKRRERLGAGASSPGYAKHATHIINDDAMRGLPRRYMRALSPSDHALEVWRENVERAKENVTTRPDEVDKLARNDISVALFIAVGDCYCILGADLKRSSNPGLGWSGVLAGRSHLGGKATLFKIPHHGAENADDARVWAELLVADPAAAVAPFASCTPRRPSISDRQRIRTRTTRAYLCTDPDADRPATSVGAYIPGAVEKIRRLPGIGQVRWRYELGKPARGWTVALSDNAQPV